MKKSAVVLLLGVLTVYLLTYFASFNVPVSSYTHSLDSVHLNMKQKEEELLRFVERNLLGPEGEVYTRPESDGAGRSVLSESIGLLMQYCIISGRQSLFDKELLYMEKHMLNENGYLRWRIGDAETCCNAIVDDFRIIEALCEAYDKWGHKKYRCRVEMMQKALLEKLVHDGELYELYDWESDQAKRTIPLCYLNLYTMDRIRIFDGTWLSVEARGEELIRNGLLDSPIPLYYKYYSYEKAQYGIDGEYRGNGGINLTYTLIVLDNLTRMNCFSRSFTEWLDYETKSGKLYAWYNPHDLKPISDIESTAVYALAASYAGRTGEKELSARLLTQMMRLRVEDTDSPFYGGFGHPGEFYSFDNLTALLALAMINEH